MEVKESCAEQELNGLEESEDAMTDEEGGVGGDGEAGTADGRVRAGPRNKLTASEREEHEATHMPFRDWCTHCVMGRGRTHHHVSKKRSFSRRPVLAMNCHSTANSQTTPDESVTCIAVKEHRHQNIMSSAVLKKGIEEPWTSERVTRFINSLGYKEITLKSDTEPATISFRNRAAENCNEEVTLEDAVKGAKPSNGLVENAVMLLRGVIKHHQVPCGELHTRRTPRRLPDLAVAGGTCGKLFVQVPEGPRWSDAI